ncbi:hypothetical protein ACIGXM_00340 [Kitasatospora sp. NPDC052896]|uniref:hypothetical protein n=1 Tax=Kitasatospora sp. NPDC052896 TaxID=3364061 RepID=UPI0037CAABDD
MDGALGSGGVDTGLAVEVELVDLGEVVLAAFDPPVVGDARLGVEARLAEAVIGARAGE